MEIKLCQCFSFVLVSSQPQKMFLLRILNIYTKPFNDVLGKQKLVLKTHLFSKIVKYFAFFTEASSV